MTADRKKAEAKKYLDRVIDQMALSDSDLKAIVQKRIKQVIDISFSYSYLGKSFHFADNQILDDKVDEIFEQIHSDIFNIIYIRADNADTLAHQKEKQEKSNKFLLLFLSMVVAGLTVTDRINRYVMQMRSEVEAYIAVGLANGMTRTQVLSYYMTWLKLPYKSPLLLDAFKRQGFKAERIKSRGITFGSGKYVSSFSNLVRLEQDTIFRAYNHAINSIWLGNSDILGWYTVRGSNYPCNLCDDNVGMFHDKREFFVGWHPRCCCIMLPVYNFDLK